MNSTPIINSSNVHFMQPFALLDFYSSPGNLKEPFKFLGAIKAYAEYYKKYEKRIKKQAVRSAYLKASDHLERKELRPLRMYHAFDSFWKDFRIKAKNEDAAFFLMPIRIKLQSEAESSYPNLGDVRAYAYLFPFGVLCVNLRIINAEDLTFRELVRKISPCRRSKKGKGFMKWAKEIAFDISKSLFKESQKLYDFLAHTLFFLDETDMSPVIEDPEHRKAIAGLIQCDEDFAGWDEKYVDRLLECELPKIRRTEVLIFHPRTTFLYPSSEDLDNYQKDCMRKNYVDFLNFISAVNHFTRALVNKKIHSPHSRLKDVKKAFGFGFPSHVDYNLRYFKNLYPIIAKKIGLDVEVKKFMEQS